MATQTWQSRLVAPGGGAGPPSHWVAPGTINTQTHGLNLSSSGAPSGASTGSTTYAQSPSLPLYRGPGQVNSGPGVSLLLPAAVPPGSPSGVIQSSGPFTHSTSVQPPLLYGPPMGTYPGPRWQLPARGSASVPSALKGGRGVADGQHLGPPRPPLVLGGPSLPGASQSGSPSVSTALPQPPLYQQYSSGPGPQPQLMGSWMHPPTSSQILQRPSFPSFSNSFQGSYPSRMLSVPEMVGTGRLTGSCGSTEDASLPTQGAANTPSNVWGNETHFNPTFPPSAKDPQFPLKHGSIVIESAGSKTLSLGPGGDIRQQHAVGKTVKMEAVDVPDACWTAHKSTDGAVYYYNSIRGQSTYEKPPGFKGEAEEVTAQPTPVSWEKLNGTDWALVTTNDGKKYYYNAKSQATSWQAPPEVIELKRKQVEEAAVKTSVEVGAAPGIMTEKSTVSFTLNVPAAVSGGREAIGHKGLVINSALDLIKKKLQDSGVPISSTPSPTAPGTLTGPSGSLTDILFNKAENYKEKSQGTNVDAVSSDSSSDSDEEDPGPTKEKCILQFKEMLKEKGIAPFSKWEKELPKIIFDFRFKAIPSHTERRAIFEHYVRTRADEERKEKRAAQKAAIEGFKQLLDEASKEFSYRTTYEHFTRAWGEDSRFEALDRKDRETLLNERVLPLRKVEDNRLKAEQAVAVEAFRTMLGEKTDINVSNRWSKVKEGLRSDPRYCSIKREDREGLFNAYVTDLLSLKQEAERAAKAKRDEEEKMKERERALRKRKKREELEMERVRMKASRKDAIIAYQALLTEKIKDPEACWTDARPKLEKDSLGRATNPELELVDRERYFREHTNEIFERCAREYRLLLSDVITVDSVSKEGGKEVLTSWLEAKKLLRLDPRFAKMPRRDRETYWHRYAEDMQRRMQLAMSAKPKSEREAGNGVYSAISVESSRRSPPLKRSGSGR